jgi:hypothetical protein
VYLVKAQTATFPHLPNFLHIADVPISVTHLPVCLATLGVTSERVNSYINSHFLDFTLI